MPTFRGGGFLLEVRNSGAQVAREDITNNKFIIITMTSLDSNLVFLDVIGARLPL